MPLRYWRGQPTKRSETGPLRSPRATEADFGMDLAVLFAHTAEVFMRAHEPSTGPPPVRLTPSR